MIKTKNHFFNIGIKIIYMDGQYYWKPFPVNIFKWIENISHINENFIKNYNEEKVEGYFFQADVQYPEKLYELHNYLLFLPGKMKTERDENLVANIHDKAECNTHRKLKTGIKSGISLEEKVNRVIKFNHNASLKPYIGMNADL